MVHRTAPLVLVALAAFGARAQCSETSQHKVLLVGDSWAFFMGVDQTINTVLNKWGHSGYTYYTNLTLAENGAETSDFLSASKQAEIQARIDQFPSIEVVHLSIGGNDVLGDWHVSFTPQQTDSLGDAVYARLLQVIEFIKGTRPGMRILWSGYCYPNFGEVIGSLPPFLQSTHPFYDTWADMGFPSFTQLNTILNDFSAAMAAYCLTDPQVDFVPATGLMQHTFGQNTPLAVPPGGSYPPGTAPLPEGFPEYPSPQNSMRDYLLTKDCFHLSPQGYRDLIEEHTKHFYHKFLMNDAQVLASGGNLQGTVNSLGSVSADPMIGEAGGVEYAAVLSFDLSALPDTGISKASLFLRRQSLLGSNPISNSMRLRVRHGHFGGNAWVEGGDWGAPADAQDIPCRFGSNGGNGHWIRLDLPPTLVASIVPGSTVQFQLLAASGFTGGQLTFTGSDDPHYAPVLDLTFGEQTVGISHTGPADFGPYPNPTAGLVTFHTDGAVLQVEVYDAMGRRMPSVAAVNGTIDLQPLPDGLYLLHVFTPDGTAVHRVVKQD